MVWSDFPNDADSGAVGQDDMSSDDLHTLENVVGDQKVSVEVAEVYGRGELCCRRNGA